MKAKEYAQKINEASDKFAAIADVAEAFLKETEAIGKQRRIRTNSAFFALLEEQDRKWQAMARKCPVVRADGFKTALRLVMPTIYTGWTGLPADTSPVN